VQAVVERLLEVDPLLPDAGRAEPDGPGAARRPLPQSRSLAVDERTPLSSTATSVSRGSNEGSSPASWSQRSANTFVQPRPDDVSSCLPVTYLNAVCPWRSIERTTHNGLASNCYVEST
jgi:hypothetical protein